MNTIGEDRDEQTETLPNKPGQESVWDYPKPPRLEPVSKRLRVVFNGATVADTARGKRVLESSHPPVYYFPRDDIRMDCLRDATGSSFCEWKGQARYFNIDVNGKYAERAAWSYAKPTNAFIAIRDHFAFYCHMMDACFVGDEQARPQPGSFYGGWVTGNIVGPFKGEPGTAGW
jgi:uncharacterized protein (DUF427 family)